MKKLVLLLAVAFSVSMFSCGGGEKTEECTDSTTCENTEAVEQNTEATEENTDAIEATEGTEENTEATAENAEATTEAPAEAAK